MPEPGGLPKLGSISAIPRARNPAQRFSIGRWVGTGFLIVGLAVLAWLTSQLAATRIYQVDECQNIYMSRVLASGETGHFFTNGSFFLLGPLSSIVGRATQSAQVFSNARLLSLGVFWFNLALMAVIASGRGPSRLTLLSLFVGVDAGPALGLRLRNSPRQPGFDWCAFDLVDGSRSTDGRDLVRACWVSLHGVAICRRQIAGLRCSPVSGDLDLPSACVPCQTVAFVSWDGEWSALLSIFSIRLLYGRSGAWDIYLSVFNHVTQ